MSAELLRQAAAIYAETGLTPDDLLRQRAELREALRKYMAAGFGNSTDFYAQGQAYDAAVEAIAKSTGAKTP